jgi:hypothetical protein
MDLQLRTQSRAWVGRMLADVLGGPVTGLDTVPGAVGVLARL